jgi:DNA segregation ATPase FtsK/SpoIIIE-like protein
MFGRNKSRPVAGNGLHPYVGTWERGLYQTLTRHSIVYRIEDKARGPQVFTFRLRLADPADLNKILSLSEQLALTMSVSSVRIARHLGLVDVEVSLPRPFYRSLPVRALQRKGKTWVALGQTATGTPVHVNLSGNRTCHALVSGMTGSGKTLTQQLIAWTLATDNDPRAVKLLLVDGKGGTAWWAFARTAHLAHPVIGDPNEAVAALTWCVVEMDRRKADRQRLPRLFIIVDEVRELLDVGGKPVAEAICRIAGVGRELGMHIIVATQHALTDAVGGSIAKANLPLRLTGCVVNSQAAYVATGVKSSGAETLQGNGDFLLTVAGEVHRLQIALLQNRDLGQLPRTEATPRLDFGDCDPVRVLEMTERPTQKPIEGDYAAVAYALATDCGVRTLRKQFGPMGTDRARRVRDFARTLRAKLADLGYCYPLPVTDISAETAQSHGLAIPGVAVTGNTQEGDQGNG